MTGYPKMMLPQNVSCHWQFIKWCCGVPAILGYCALHVFDDAVHVPVSWLDSMFLGFAAMPRW